MVRPLPHSEAPEQVWAESNDCHLRSVAEVSGYRVAADDRPIGHVADVLFEEGTWVTRFVVVATSDWWRSEHVMVPAEHIRAIEWPNKAIRIKRQTRPPDDPSVSAP